MTAFEAFQIYHSLRLYFKDGSTYDFFKFNGKTSLKRENFEKRKDKHRFEKLARTYSKKDMINLLVANIISNRTPDWVGDLLDEAAEETYRNWRKRVEALGYMFIQDLEKISEFMYLQGLDFNQLFVPKQDGSHPPIFKLYYRQEIMPETFLIFDRVLGFSKNLDKKLGDDVVWVDLSNKLRKYNNFLEIDEPKFRKIVKEKFLG